MEFDYLNLIWLIQNKDIIKKYKLYNVVLVIIINYENIKWLS